MSWFSLFQSCTWGPTESRQILSIRKVQHVINEQKSLIVCNRSHRINSGIGVTFYQQKMAGGWIFFVRFIHICRCTLSSRSASCLAEVCRDMKNSAVLQYNNSLMGAQTQSKMALWVNVNVHVHVKKTGTDSQNTGRQVTPITQFLVWPYRPLWKITWSAK